MKSIALLVFTMTLAAQSFDLKSYNKLLSTYIDNNGNVDYQSIKLKEEKIVDKLLEELNKVSLDDVKNLSSNAKQAFWINAYNLNIIKTIIKNNEKKSIKDIYFPGFRVWKINHQIGGKDFSFDNIEHDILRKEFKDPLIHVTINCASVSCPKLQNRAFTENNIDSLKQAGIVYFFKQERYYKLDKASKKLELSAIMDWFKEDFYNKDKGETIINFILKYVSKEDIEFITKNKQDLNISYLDYDWNLNSKK